jgi:pimeloyl-ACP methyl ester carboxylesterase
VVAPWLPGYLPVPAGEGVRLATVAADVAALAASLGASRVHVVGHDWGALVGWRLAADRPDVVASLTALSVPHPRAMLTALPRGQALRSAYVGLFRLPVVADHVLGAAGGRPLRAMLRGSGLPPSFTAAYVDHFRVSGTLPGALSWYRANGARELRAVGPVAVPTRFVWGRRDPSIGRRAADGCAGQVTGRFRFDVVDEGHWLPERQPATVARAVLDHVAGT